jgi:hypothetical protein
VGRYYHAETNTEWQIVEWGKDGSSLKNTDEYRLTQKGIDESQLTTFAIVHANGKVKHATFAGYLPDLDTLADYWDEEGSL